jgi:hypothetical protein
LRTGRAVPLAPARTRRTDGGDVEHRTCAPRGRAAGHARRAGAAGALRLLRRFWWVAVLAVGGLYWFWDSTHHDHPGPHGAPLTVREAERASLGEFAADDGTVTNVTDASCAGGEDGNDSGTSFTHFRCPLTFAGGETDEVVIHVMPDGLEFRSEKS